MGAAARKSEAFFELPRLQITQADGERVGSVRRLGSFLHMQKRADHHLNLTFVGMAITRYAGLYFARRIAADLDMVLFGSEKNNTTHFSQAESRSHI